MEEAKYAVLKKYIPIEFVPIVAGLLKNHTVRFKIVKPRKTKLGDFRYDPREKKYQITINGDLNPYSFLITTLHEFAHLICHKNHGYKVSPHGKEWKHYFNELLQPVMHSEHTPPNIKNALRKSTHQIKASSCTDIALSRALMEHDEDDGLTLLESLPKESVFELNKKIFQKGVLRRTRYLCLEVHTGKQYLVNRLSKVKKL